MPPSVDNALWVPTNEQIKNSQMHDFMSFVNQSCDQNIESYEALFQWSIKEGEAFWSGIWDYFDVMGTKGSSIVQDKGKMPGAKWFPNASLNFAENLLKHADINPDAPALIERNEDGRRLEISYRELKHQVNCVAHHLKNVGIKQGDVVAGILPNSHYSVVSMLATTSMGAIWTSCSPDFGANGILDRFSQTKPKLLIACNAYNYGLKVHNCCDKIREVMQGLPSIENCIVADFIAEETQPEEIPKSSAWNDILNAPLNEELTYSYYSFNHPLYILYSSGTTGKPKCIVHGVGGTLLQHLKELSLHTNVTNETKLFYFTTCGWMMWNWLVSGLALGATLVLYDGSPFHPEKHVLFDLIDEEEINVFGAGAKYYSACEKFELHPQETHNLKSLDALLSTGSPLSHESFDYLYNRVKQNVCVSSISGGTDIISCFALGNPTLPVYRGELQCLGLGMDVAFVDDTGESILQGKGELVCNTSFPSMPTGFWDDPENEKYTNAYFKRFSNKWAHGDYGEFISHTVPKQRGVIIHGRSDAVLNPGGVRIGTAEIYRQVEKIDEVFESIAIGQEWRDDVRVILFVRLKENCTLDDSLRKKIKTTIRENTTPRHVPSKVIQVSDIPRTLSGKIVELAVRNIVHGKEVKNTEALANPDALKLYSNLEELEVD